MVRIVFALVLVACVEPKSTGVGDSHVEAIDIPGGPTSALDLVFVIDDSPAMANYGVSVASLGYELERAFRSAPGGMLDLQVAAITTTGGGVLRSASTIDGRFAVDTHAPDGTRTENFDGSLTYAVTQLVSAGATSTAASQPFAAARHLLEAPPAGFRRPGASLGIVIVTVQDDASPDSPEAFATFLNGLSADPSKVVVIDISSGSTPRLAQLTDMFGLFLNRTAHTDLSTGDLGHAFDLFDQLLKTDLGAPCVTAADADPTTDGPQYDCSFKAVREDGTETTLVPCNTGRAGGCWKLAPDQICLAPTLRLFVRGFAETSRPHIRGSCVAR
jgi:hypothetical protein